METILGYAGYILGLYWDNGKENGNYNNGLYRVYVGVILGLMFRGIRRKKPRP